MTNTERVEVLTEERSMEASLRHLLPRILHPSITFGIYPFRDKQDLLGTLPSRLRGYAGWLPANWRIVVLVDRDDDDCGQLKQQLNAISRDSNQAPSRPLAVIHRIVIDNEQADRDSQLQ